MILAIYFIFVIFILVFVFTATAQQKNARTQIRTVRKPNPQTYSRTNHEDHTRPLPHNRQATFLRNNEKDIVKDPPLSEAERNVLHGR